MLKVIDPIFLEELQKNVNETLATLVKNNISLDTTDFRETKSNVYDISYLTNGGDIRSIEIYFSTPTKTKKRNYFKIELKDKSIGSGLYTRLAVPGTFFSTYSKDEQPFAWQCSLFDYKKCKKLSTLDGKNVTFGEKITFLEEFDEILKPIYDLFWRDEQFLINYFYSKNMQNRIDCIRNNNTSISREIEEKDLIAFVPKHQNLKYFN